MRTANRREFLETLGTYAAATTWSGTIWAVDRGSPPLKENSPSLGTETANGLIRSAVAADCFALADRSTGICSALKRCLGDYPDTARLGAAASLSGSMALPEVVRIRKALESDADKERAEGLALVAGKVCGLAADRHRDVGIGDGGEPGRSLYRAAFVLREIGTPEGLDGVSASQVEEFLAALWQRTLIRWHTFIPDSKDVEAWIGRLSKASRKIPEEARMLAEALCEPDQAKVERYIVKPNFYDPNDPLIRRARAVDTAPNTATRYGSDGRKRESTYAMALGRGYQNLQAVSEYLQRRATEEQLEAELGS